MSRRRKRSKKGRAGRLFEVVANTVLVLIVLAFGLSIAKRFGADDANERRVEPTAQRVRAPEPTIDPEILRQRPTVDIRNGCGESGLAEQLMNQLRRSGFDVVEYRNADRYDYERTLIKDRSGREGAPARLRDWMRREYGVGEIVDDKVGVPEADLVLIIGSDFADTLRVRAARTR
jgi:hypothetical protein